VGVVSTDTDTRTLRRSTARSTREIVSNTERLFKIRRGFLKYGEVVSNTERLFKIRRGCLKYGEVV
jgi:hypothetical protein